jgi:Tfp pilus assembly protein PilX
MPDKARFVCRARLFRGCGNDKGIALAAILFLLVTIGAMGLVVSMIVKNQQEQSANHLQSYRAYYSAASGIEWAYERAFEMGWSGAALSNLSGTYALPNDERFTITFNAPDLLSSSTTGGVTRTLKFVNFAGRF